MWAVVVGLVLGVLVLLLVVSTQRDLAPGPGGGGGQEGPGPTSEPTADVAVPIGDEPIPGVGRDVFIAGGLTTVAVPDGWTLLARGDRPDDPGGYSESAVLANRQSGITLGVYLLPGTTAFGEALAIADSGARDWTRDGTEAQFEPARELDPFGTVAGAALVRYRYVRAFALEGEVVAAIRQDGVTLLVSVEGGAGALEAARGTWQPLRDEVLRIFAGVSA